MSEFVHITELRGTSIYEAIYGIATRGLLDKLIDQTVEAAGYEYKIINGELYVRLVDQQKNLIWTLSQ